MATSNRSGGGKTTEPSKSSSQSSKQPKPTKTRAVSLSPRNSINVLDITHELIISPDTYRGEDEWLTIVKLPGYVRMSLERYQITFSPRDRPGLNLICNAAISSALNVFEAHPEIILFRSLRERMLSLSRYSDDNLLAIIAQVMDLFTSLDPFPGDLSGKGQFNFKIPEFIMGRLGELAKAIGVSNSILATLCIAESMSSPDCFGSSGEISTVEGHVNKMRKAVDDWVYLTGVRCNGVRDMLDRVESERSIAKTASVTRARTNRGRK